MLKVSIIKGDDKMELRHFRYFVVLAEELHFRRAAERLNIAQPPLSQQIKDLEEEIGAPLFFRTKKKVTLTDSGKAFLPRAKQILRQVDKACEEVREIYLGQKGQIVIGFAGGTTYDLLRFQKTFQEAYPDVEVMLRRLGTADQVEALHQEKIDIGFLYPPIESDQLTLFSLPQQGVIAAVPENHPLATITGPVDTKELKKESFIITPQKAGTSYRNVLFNLFYRAGFVPKVTMEAYEIETALSFVASEMGITLVPSSYQRRKMQGVVYKELLEQTSTFETAMVWRSNEDSSAALAFIETVRQSLNQSENERY